MVTEQPVTNCHVKWHANSEKAHPSKSANEVAQKLSIDRIVENERWRRHLDCDCHHSAARLDGHETPLSRCSER